MDDPNNTNNSPTDAGVGNRQAIFTPQPEAANPPETPQPPTTVNTAADITPPTPPASDATHPFLSNHPTQTFNTNTGDIILGGAVPKTKQNKRPIFIGVAIILVCLAVVAVILMAASGVFGEKQVSTAEVRTKWNEFTTYLENGPEGASRDEENWFLLEAGGFGYPDVEQTEFIDQSRSLYADFIKMYNKSPVKSETLDGLIAQNTELFDVALKYLNLEHASKDLVNKLLADGEAAALGDIATLLPEKTSTEQINTLIDVMNQYLMAKIYIYNIYREADCLTDGEPDEYCEILTDGNQRLEQLDNQFETAEEQMMSGYRWLITEIHQSMQAISGALNA